MSKRSPSKPQGTKQHQAPIPAASSDGTFPGDTLKEGNGVILGMGKGIPAAAPPNQRLALIAAATGGDANAQSQVGDCYRVGDEFAEQDFAEALRWYTLAAAQGDPCALNNLGAMYGNAFGVPKDMVEAVKWYRLSADQGLSTAQFNLAECLLYGNGVKEDAEEAARWLHLAVKQGHIEALCELGTLYRWGHGVEKRIAIAAEMLTIAALAGDADALGNLADYHPLIEADAKDGSMLSALSLAKMFDRGLGVEANKMTEFAWLTWGEQYGNRDDDADVREELVAMKAFYSMVISPADKKVAKKLVKQMATIPGVDGMKPKRRTKALPQQERMPTPKPIKGGG